MINAKIKEGHIGFYHQYGNKKFALLEDAGACQHAKASGQTLKAAAKPTCD